jgi:predicted MFS family arabinose efflux permease
MATHREALKTPGARRRLSASYLWLGWVAGFGAVVAEVASRKLSLSPTDTGLLAGFYGLAVIAGNLASGKLQRMAGEAALPGAALVAAVGLLGFMLPVGSMAQLALLGLPWAFGYGCAGPLHHARLSALSERCRGTINSYHASLLNLGIFSVSFALGTVVPRFSVTLFCGLVGVVTLLGACLLIPWPRRKTQAVAA